MHGRSVYRSQAAGDGFVSSVSAVFLGNTNLESNDVLSIDVSWIL